MFFFSESDDYKSDVPDFCQSISFFFHLRIDAFPCFYYYLYYHYFFTVTVTILIYGPVKLARFDCHRRPVTLLWHTPKPYRNLVASSKNCRIITSSSGYTSGRPRRLSETDERKTTIKRTLLSWILNFIS